MCFYHSIGGGDVNGIDVWLEVFSSAINPTPPPFLIYVLYIHVNVYYAICTYLYICISIGGGDVNGIDVWLEVFSSGIALQYVNDKSGNTWFPISSLYVCAAVKCNIEMNPNGDKNPKFVALDSDAAKQSRHPPMFACIMRRTKGVKVSMNVKMLKVSQPV